MAWTYDPTALNQPLNELRLKIGDTNTNDQQLQDEELQLFLDSTSSVQGASVLALRALAAKYARYVDKWVGDLKILASQRYRAYQQQLDELVGSSVSGMPYAGGIRVSDKAIVEDDTDLTKSAFRRGMHDFECDP